MFVLVCVKVRALLAAPDDVNSMTVLQEKLHPNPARLLPPDVVT